MLRKKTVLEPSRGTGPRATGNRTPRSLLPGSHRDMKHPELKGSRTSFLLFLAVVPVRRGRGALSCQAVLTLSRLATSGENSPSPYGNLKSGTARDRFSHRPTFHQGEGQALALRSVLPSRACRHPLYPRRTLKSWSRGRPERYILLSGFAASEPANASGSSICSVRPSILSAETQICRYVIG